MKITSIDQLDLKKTYSYADYLLWQFAERVELLKGYIMKMAAPKRYHQKIVGKLHAAFFIFLKKRPCEVYLAPFDVRLYNSKKSVLLDKEIFTVVQPDLCVICDLEKLDDRGCNGSPEFIIEIISPNSTKRDVKDKFELYQETGVLEYWLISPEAKTMTKFVLEDEKYVFKGIFTPEDTVSPHLFEELEIDLSEIFED